ncbi:MAG: methyltransferase domain-containing protein [Gammaproteobacteria bacterium]|nr:methyltransferase domain-containing protein [Gammaproteobacteria bacterium]
MKSLVSKLPEWLKKPLRYLRGVVIAAAFCGKKRFCPVCGKSSRRFRSFGIWPREDAQCPHCGALERHRLLWLFLQKKVDFFDGQPKKVLHVAPESCFESRFRKQLGDGYLTADLFRTRAMVKMDIVDIQYADQSFDVIFCSHVLEHVVDDRRAMKEFFRVLKNTGWAILNVPITSVKTFEDSSVIEPDERLRTYGQVDHVRRYGSDYVERLLATGFTVDIIKVDDLVDSHEKLRLGLSRATDDIYYCTK